MGKKEVWEVLTWVEHHGVRGQGGHAKVAACRRQGVQRHLRGGRVGGYERHSGLGEAAADRDTAEKGCVQGLPVQHRDLLRPGDSWCCAK